MYNYCEFGFILSELKRGKTVAVRICVLDSSVLPLPESDITCFGKAENKRLEEIKNPARRQESRAGLLALRKAVGDRDYCDIVRDGYSKPRFERDVGLSFNISHSGNLSVAAVCDGGEKRIGVDIELVKEKSFESCLRIADRYFGESEYQKLKDSRDISEFYKVWTAREAYSKLLGKGLSWMLGNKNESVAVLSTFHFSLTYSGCEYVLCLCTENEANEEIDFILDGGIVVVPFKEG